MSLVSTSRSSRRQPGCSSAYRRASVDLPTREGPPRWSIVHCHSSATVRRRARIKVDDSAVVLGGPRLRWCGVRSSGQTVAVTDVALFHSALGVGPGVIEAADRLRADGHDVVVVDQYDGRVFDDYQEAGEFAESMGYPTLMRLAEDAVSGLADGFIAAGFSNGGGMAEFVATRRSVRGVLMLSGALDLNMIGVEAWPSGVPAQIHYATDDPFRDQAGIDAVAAQVSSAGASIEIFDYPGSGHLFTDPSLPDEYDAHAAELLWSRVLTFCA